MSSLNIRLLGPIRVDLDGQPITKFETDKVRSLLVYLAVEKNQAHRREVLAGLFWPEYSDQRARANLSQALYTLRRSIGDDSDPCPFLIINSDSIQFVPDSKLWLDVDVFTNGVMSNRRAVSRPMIRDLEEIVALYQGEFLEGFSLSASSQLESWCLFMRERLHRLMSEALRQLSDYYERIAEHEIALGYARRLLDLDAWREEAHVTVMRLLALNGRRSEALAQYEACRLMLEENLGIAPMRQTTTLYEMIRDGQLGEAVLSYGDIPISISAIPSFLAAAPASPPTTIFVGRVQELAWLDQKLECVLGNRGRMAFVAGEAGSGKTILTREFSHQAMARFPELLVASGKGTAYTGLGDPYASFREIASQLTGNVATLCAAGTISRLQALRLWRSIPLAVQALVQDAPDLIDTLVNRANLLDRGLNFAQEAGAQGMGLERSQRLWLDQLELLSARRGAESGLMGQHQSALFEQFTRFLTTLARHRPLLLVLDDLQWADAGTIGLLFHISRNLAGQRILILGAYRPEEISVTQDGRRHPLEPVIHEIRNEYGDVILELGQDPDPSFVDALVDSEPNRLDAAFRKKLFQQTEGHPLYTAELLRGLQERGDLYKNREGLWDSGTDIDWDTLPPRVEGVIAERIGRLPRRLQHLLRAASVQGESFIGEVAARVLQIDEDEALSALGNTLSRDHRLVQAQSFERADNGGAHLSTYQFHHFLFQKYLYGSLDSIDRARLHEATGETLTPIFGDHITEMSVQLARHFEISKNNEKAIGFRLQAGNYAIKLAANDQAIDHFSKGLTLLETLPESAEKTTQQLALQLGLGTGYQLLQGYASPEAHRAYSRALDLCRQVGDSPELVSALWPLATRAAMIGDLTQGVALAEEALAVARRVNNPLFIAVAHHHLGWILYQVGHFVESCYHQDEIISFYDRRYHEEMVHMFGHDFGVTSLGWSSWPLWYLGYPDKALQRGQEAIALAQSFDHPFSLMHAYNMTAMIHVVRGDLIKAGEFGERIMDLATSNGYHFYIAPANYYLGAGLIGQGQITEGIAYQRKSMVIYEATGVRMLRGTYVGIAKIYAGLDQYELGQEALAEAEALDFDDYSVGIIEHTRGLLLQLQGAAAEEAEACFLRAIEIARLQQAKSSELQATMSLCRLWQEQGRENEAREKLAGVYGWFTEGFDTADLKDAAALLEQLA